MNSTGATMQEMARELNLSRLTVSLVLNGHAKKRGIADATIRRVNEHLKRRGYVRNRSAMRLRGGAKHTVGILHCGRLHSHLSDAFSKMVDQLSKSEDTGVEIMISSRGNVVEGIGELVSRGIGSLIWIHATVSQIELKGNSSLLGFLSNVPTVIYNYLFDVGGVEKDLENAGVHMVGVSRKQGYEKLAVFMRKSGHRRVVVPDVKRIQAKKYSNILDGQFIEALESEGLNPVFVNCPVYPSGSRREDGLALAREVIKAFREDAVTAACFRDDETAGYAMTHLLDAGIRIPEDLSVTSFDGHPLAEAFRVGLTTLSLPVGGMVQKVFQVLNQWDQPRQHRFDIELILRNSHRKLPSINS